ncbi:MAG TPA: InlB B-repeat-containing protein, partial [Spirochaetota bacterium]|nr:InlB B-repeat-containing protein [Spirochaetota bacterium]
MVKRIILPVLPLIVALFISCGDSYSDMLEGGFSGTFLHVTYDSNNSTSGTPPADMNTYSTGLSVTVPDNSGVLDRTGYTFNGWNTAPDGSGTGYSPLDSFTIGSNSVTLYAWWIPIPFTVTFDSQGGSAVSPQTENYDSLVTEPAAPARTGYTFTGWFREPACTSQWIFATDTVAGDMHLYAGWNPIPYTVTFDSQGGSAVSSQAVIYGDLVTEPADPTRVGHTFGGWFTEPACTTQWMFAADTVTGDTALYAQWTIITYTLTYTPGPGGSISGTTPQTVNHGSDGSMVTAIPDTGYHFVQWTNGSTNPSRTDTGVTADITQTASFAINQYTLTYTALAGGSISGTATQTVNHGSDGSPVTAVPDTGYQFYQWSDGSTANPRTDTGVTGDITQTASFAINQYTLTYTAASGGTISGATPQTVNHGSDGTAVTAMPSTGYHFEQWNDGITTATRTDTGVTGNISVSALFTINQYTVTYDGNGSTGGSAPPGNPYTYYYNNTVIVQNNSGSFVKTGYTFTGWN